MSRRRRWFLDWRALLTAACGLTAFLVGAKL
jgi:hypothetical protein